MPVPGCLECEPQEQPESPGPPAQPGWHTGQAPLGQEPFSTAGSQVSRVFQFSWLEKNPETFPCLSKEKNSELNSKKSEELKGRWKTGVGIFPKLAYKAVGKEGGRQSPQSRSGPHRLPSVGRHWSRSGPAAEEPCRDVPGDPATPTLHLGSVSGTSCKSPCLRGLLWSGLWWLKTNGDHQVVGEGQRESESCFSA